MGLLNAVFGDHKQRLLGRMSNLANLAKIGIAKRVVTNMEGDDHARDMRMRIASATVNLIFSEEYADPAVRQFATQHKSEIAKQIAELAKDQHSREVITQSVRVLSTINFQNGAREKVLSPIQRLEELTLLIPGGKDPEPETFRRLVERGDRVTSKDSRSRMLASRFPWPTHPASSARTSAILDQSSEAHSASGQAISRIFRRPLCPYCEARRSRLGVVTLDSGLLHPISPYPMSSASI